MGEAHLDDVGDQPVGQLVPGQEACRRRGAARSRHAPRRWRSARGGDWRCARRRGAPRRPIHGRAARSVTEAVAGRSSERKAKGSAFKRQAHAIGADDLELVGPALADVGQEDLPDAGVLAQPHRVAAAVPVVEVADHRDPAGIGRPDREMDAEGALVLDQMRAELVEQPEMRAFGDVVVVHRAEHRAEANRDRSTSIRRRRCGRGSGSAGACSSVSWPSKKPASSTRCSSPSGFAVQGKRVDGTRHAARSSVPPARCRPHAGRARANGIAMRAGDDGGDLALATAAPARVLGRRTGLGPSSSGFLP